MTNDGRGRLQAKFFQQYRLFFRYHAAGKVIVFAWINDDDTKRAYESDDDAYQVFKKMLDKGNPPDDWDALVFAAGRKNGHPRPHHPPSKY